MAEVVVVGSGIAGLSAAYDLQVAGHQVTVLERESFPGGRMADRIENGICVHTGASIIFSFNTEMFDLIDRLGIREDVIAFGDKNEGYTVDNGSMRYKLKLTFDPIFLLGHPAFGILTKTKLAALLPDMIRAGLDTDPCFMHTAHAFDDETVADYITRKVSAEFLENYVEPYFRAPWHWEPEQISRAYLLNLLGHVVGAELMSFRYGIGHLTRVLASRLDVRYGAEVEAIKLRDDGCVLRLRGNGVCEDIEADYVICATQGTLVTRIVQDLSAEDRAFFDSVRYNRGARVYYRVEGGLPEDRCLWFSRAAKSDISLFHAFCEDTVVPEGHHQPAYIQVELTPELSARIAAEGGKENLDRYVRHEVVKHYPEVADRIRQRVEQWWDHMLTEWYPGYARRVKLFLERQEQTPRRIYFCGDYLSQSHTGGACASGRHAARLLERHRRDDNHS